MILSCLRHRRLPSSSLGTGWESWDKIPSRSGLFPSPDGAPLRHGNLLDKHGKIHYQLQVGFNDKRKQQIEFVQVFRDVQEAEKTLGEVRRGQEGYDL